MSDEDKFWLRFWQTVAAVIITITLSIGGCTVHQNKKMTEAILHGVSPERARLAYSCNTTSSELIVALMKDLEDKKE